MNTCDTLQLETIDLAGWRLRVQFERCKDRYAHRVFLDSKQRSELLLESIEGSDQDPWPVSPPFQQLSFQEQSNALNVALLVGMAGKSHWSMSVEVAADRPALIFDVACRCQQPAERLMSRYRISLACLPTSDPHTALFDVSGCKCSLLTETVDDSLPAQIQSSNQEISIVAATLSGEELPTTVRWKYKICLG